MAYRHCGNQQPHAAHDWSPMGEDMRCTGTEGNPATDPMDELSSVDAYCEAIRILAKARGDEIVTDICDQPGNKILGVETVNGLGISVQINFTP